jgi:Ca2+-binding EF-hand superfamily protein
MSVTDLRFALPALAAAFTLAASGAAAQAPALQPQKRADIAAKLEAEYKNVDSNGDGTLDAAEIQAAQAKAAQAASDALSKRLETEFVKLDTNNDKQLSLAEFKAAAAARPSNSPAEVMEQMDKNKDGKVTVEEYRDRALVAFDRLDTNKDGTVSVEEQRAAAAPNRR